MKIIKLLKKILLYSIILSHLLVLGFTLWYTINTNSVSTINVYSSEYGVLRVLTPNGAEMNFKLSQGDSLTIYKRPITSIIYTDSLGKEYTLDLKNLSEDTCVFENTGFTVVSNDCSSNKFLSVLDFFFFNLKGIQIYLIGWLMVLAISIMLLLYQYKKIRYLKMRFYRFLLKGKGHKRTKLQPIQLLKHQKIALFVAILVLIPVMYLNLGNHPFSQKKEEKRRALVSLEMKLNNNYIVPTTCGEPYYNKPPLFNWLILPFVDSENVEANTRAVSVTILLLIGGAIFLILRKRRGWQHALMISFLFFTSFYIISNLSFGLNLDVLFALLLVILFYLNYLFASKKKYLLLFVVGYFLCALAFLTKGIPAILFQMISLTLALGVNKDLKKLFSFAHLLGILVMILVAGGYFYLYSYNGGDVIAYLSRFGQETQVTNGYSSKMITQHIFSFPAFNIMNFTLLGLLIPLIFIRSYFLQIIKNKELLYLFLLSFLGISVFWVNAYYQPYYIIMFIPLFLDIILFLIPKFKNDSNRIAYMAIAILIILFAIEWLIRGSIGFPFFLIIIPVFFLLRKYLVDIVLLIGIVLIGWKASGNLKDIFNSKDLEIPTKTVCARIASDYPDSDICILSKNTPFNYVSVFYLTYFTNNIVEYLEDAPTEKTLCLAGANEITQEWIIVDTIPQLHWEAGGSNKFLGSSVYVPLFVIKRKM